MNKIKEFEMKSTSIVGDYSCYYRLDTDKFAELIIQECIDIFEPPKIDDPKWSYDHSMLCLDIQDKIKKHFGIEQ